MGCWLSWSCGGDPGDCVRGSLMRVGLGLLRGGHRAERRWVALGFACERDIKAGMHGEITVVEAGGVELGIVEGKLTGVWSGRVVS